MTKRCLDEGFLQAYLDGELSRERAAEAASHLAACAACAAALAEAGQETSLFANAFAPDESVNVPSEVLRSRINAAVARLESQPEPGRRHSQARSFGGFFASLSGLFSFTPRGAAAFASLLAVFALTFVYFSTQKSEPGPAQSQSEQRVAQVERPSNRLSDNPSAVTPPTAPAGTPALAPHDKGNGGPAHVRQAGHGARPVRRRQAALPVVKAEEELVPGEKDYQTAIASLEQTIKLGGDESLRPALRADYERNLALLDTAITQTRQVAARNPKDETAVSFLMAAYQSKVELLSKVADQAQVAALGR
ncbi:MAG: zf-HC2 domain-containing protein [Acidobacteria bacterium]|nr:zf-HC2 domain-containing protein [Acidobacteriota bacterium]